MKAKFTLYRKFQRLIPDGKTHVICLSAKVGKTEYTSDLVLIHSHELRDTVRKLRLAIKKKRIEFERS